MWRHSRGKGVAGEEALRREKKTDRGEKRNSKEGWDKTRGQFLILVCAHPVVNPLVLNYKC
jgi:hypothetical protein